MVELQNRSNIPKFNECGNYCFIDSIILNQILSGTRFNLAEKDGEADRKVPLQPLAFLTKDGQVSRYNLRKVLKIPKPAQ